ncbi:MAG TPA: O-antigen ligase family protein [Thermoanaerobaculia bacterium]|nr:O-antigen ligase family protein [Thermoanaerobaculia bacterium]
MTLETRRLILCHLLVLDVLIITAGVALLFPDSTPILLFGAYQVAIAATGVTLLVVLLFFPNRVDAAGLAAFAATGAAVLVLLLFFPNRADAASLTALVATGAILATIARIARVRHERLRDVELPHADLCAIGLALLCIVTYTDVSDAVMQSARLPSLLQPLIVLLLFVALRVRHTAHPLAAAQQPVVVALALYALVVFATSVWAPQATLVDERFAEVVKAIVICLLTATLAISWSTLRTAMGALVAAASALSAISIVQITTGRFLDILGGLVTPQEGAIYDRLSLPRASGPPNSDPNFYARILLLAIPPAIALALTARTRVARFAFAAAAAIITAATLLTYSRGAMLALAVTALVLLAGLRVRPSHVAFAGAAMLAGMLLLPADVARRFLTLESLLPRESTFEYDAAIEKRRLFARAGLAMFDAHPIAGIGAGHYGRDFPRFANEAGSTWINYHAAGTLERPHGLFFEIAAETGLLGLAAFGGVLAAALVSLQRSRREARARGRPELETVAVALLAAILGYLAASAFLHETHFRYLALFLGFTVAAGRLIRAEVQA